MTKPESALQFIESATNSGKTVYVSTPLRHSKITKAVIKKWEDAGRSLFKIGSDGNLLMASGNRYDSLTMGEIMLVRISAQ